MREGEYQARIDRLVELRSTRAGLDAEEQRILHALYTDRLETSALASDPELNKEWVREDVACALRVPCGIAHGLLLDAVHLVERLPRTLDLLAAGEISLRHATRLVAAVVALSDPVAAAVEKRVLERAPQQTVAQFNASLRRAVLALDPRDQQQQVADAVAQRRVVFTPQSDGTTELWALLPAETAAAIQAALETQADRLKTFDRAHPEGEQRSADQRRADALPELIFGTTAVQPRVNVTVALSTLLALDNQPGELDRHGPVPAALARVLAFDPTGTWRRLLTDDTGHVTDAGRSTYRPPSRMARTVIARQTTCVFPTCRRTAARCELDHITAWDDGGPTKIENLQPLCARHHHLKHESGWRVWRLPDGTTRWRAPSGHIHDRPPDEIPRDTSTDPDEAESPAA